MKSQKTMFFGNSKSFAYSSKAQLTAVLVIVLLVAAIGAFMIFSKTGAGKATSKGKGKPAPAVSYCGDKIIDKLKGEVCDPPGEIALTCSKIILADGRCDYPVCLNNCICPIGTPCSGGGTSGAVGIVPGTTGCYASGGDCYKYHTGTSEGTACSGCYSGTSGTCCVTYGCAMSGELNVVSRSPSGCS